MRNATTKHGKIHGKYTPIKTSTGMTTLTKLQEAFRSATPPLALDAGNPVGSDAGLLPELVELVELRLLWLGLGLPGVL